MHTQKEGPNMSLLPFAIGAMTTALTLYTIGVWGGLAFDTAGTELMRRIAGGVFTPGLHSLTGLVALLLMAAHALWATATLARGREEALRGFHRFSVAVWGLWLIPFASGALFNS